MIRLLIVDDEKGIRESLKRFFQDRGFYASTVSDGKEALEIIVKERPHIIFLDIKMGTLDGLQTLEEIKKVDKNIKVIMLTVWDEQEVIEKAMSLGADDYITKPFRTEYLEEVLIKKVQGLLDE